MSENQLVSLLKDKQKDLWTVRASYLTAGQEVYFRKALYSILESKDLAEMAKTPAGAKSIFICLSKSLQMGLQIGGHIPQAYIVGMPTKDGKIATLIPTLEGYKFIALSNPPVLKDIFISAVYEKELDGFKIDKPAGVVTHLIYPGDDRGQLIGVYAILKDLDGICRADWMTRTEIEKVRNNHSSSYKSFIAGNIKEDKCPWMTDFEMQAIKTAGKRFLKPYAALKEGLAMALASEEPEEVLQDNRNIEERVDSVLDNIIDAETVEEALPAEKEDTKNKDTKLFK